LIKIVISRAVYSLIGKFKGLDFIEWLPLQKLKKGFEFNITGGGKT